MVEIPVEKKQEIIRDLELLIKKGWEYTEYKEFSKLIGRINFLITATKARSLKRFVAPFYALLNEKVFCACKVSAAGPPFNWVLQLRELRAAIASATLVFFVSFQRCTQPPTKVWTDCSFKNG